MDNNDSTTQFLKPALPGNTLSATFDRRVHRMLNLYAVGAAAYVYYSLFTQSGLMGLWLRWIDAGWIPVGNSARGLIVFFAPALTLFLPVFLTGFAARRWAPQLARAIDSWGVRPPARRHEIQTWRSIFKVTGAVAIFFCLVVPLTFWATQSQQARKIHEIDLRDTTATFPGGANYVRLTGMVARRFWLISSHEDGSAAKSIAPLVGEHWRPADPVRYFVVADGEEPSSFREKGLIRISGEPVRAPSDIQRQAIERYRSKGLKVDPAYVMVESRDLPNGSYAPVDYDTLTGPAAFGMLLVVVVFLSQVVGRYKDKHKIGQYVIQLPRVDA